MKDTIEENAAQAAPTVLRRTFTGGVWEVELMAAARPGLEIHSTMGDLLAPEMHDGEEGTYRMRFPVPAGLLGDGMQTFLLVDAATGTTLDRLAILAGDALDEDLRAELDFMRAELALLKKAFRRHCAESP